MPSLFVTTVRAVGINRFVKQIGNIRMPKIFAGLISGCLLLIGIFISFLQFVELPFLPLIVYEDSRHLLAKFGLLFVAVGVALMLTQIFGEQIEKIAIKGLFFSGTLAGTYIFMIIVTEFVFPKNEFSHPDLDLVVACRVDPQLTTDLKPMVEVIAHEEKIIQIREKSPQPLSETEYAEGFTHLPRMAANRAYFKSTQGTSYGYKFALNGLLPITSSEFITVMMSGVTQSGDPDPPMYRIFSSYVSVAEPRKLIVDIDLQEAGDVCTG